MGGQWRVEVGTWAIDNDDLKTSADADVDVVTSGSIEEEVVIPVEMVSE